MPREHSNLSVISVACDWYRRAVESYMEYLGAQIATQGTALAAGVCRLCLAGSARLILHCRVNNEAFKCRDPTYPNPGCSDQSTFSAVTIDHSHSKPLHTIWLLGPTHPWMLTLLMVWQLAVEVWMVSNALGSWTTFPV